MPQNVLSFNRFLDQPGAEKVFLADLETPTESTRSSEEMNGITLESFVVPSQNEESSIEDDTLETDEFGENPVVTFHLKNPAYLARVANRYRQKRRPNEPFVLSFELNEEHIPDNFLRADVKVDDRRTTSCLLPRIC